MAYAVVWLTVTVYVSPGVDVATAAPNESTRLSAMLFTTLPLTKPAATPAYKFLFFMLSASRLRRGADLDLCWQSRWRPAHDARAPPREAQGRANSCMRNTHPGEVWNLRFAQANRER